MATGQTLEAWGRRGGGGGGEGRGDYEERPWERYGNSRRPRSMTGRGQRSLELVSRKPGWDWRLPGL